MNENFFCVRLSGYVNKLTLIFLMQSENLMWKVIENLYLLLEWLFSFTFSIPWKNWRFCWKGSAAHKKLGGRWGRRLCCSWKSLLGPPSSIINKLEQIFKSYNVNYPKAFLCWPESSQQGERKTFSFSILVKVFLLLVRITIEAKKLSWICSTFSGWTYAFTGKIRLKRDFHAAVSCLGKL